VRCKPEQLSLSILNAHELPARPGDLGLTEAVRWLTPQHHIVRAVLVALNPVPGLFRYSVLTADVRAVNLGADRQLL
jgi:hypothetical protein